MTKQLAKKPSYRRLAQDLKAAGELSCYRVDQIGRLVSENAELQKKLKDRVDTSMITERARLASSLGQMVEAVSQAIRVVVGKEVM